MDWRREMISDLREIQHLEAFIKNYPNLINEIREQMKVIGGGCSTDERVQTSERNASEDKYINGIAKMQRLEAIYNHRKAKLESLMLCMDGLTEEEKTVIDMFFIHRPFNHVYKCMDKLQAEKSTVYRIKEAALKKLTISRYGIVMD